MISLYVEQEFTVDDSLWLSTRSRARLSKRSIFRRELSLTFWVFMSIRVIRGQSLLTGGVMTNT